MFSFKLQLFFFIHYLRLAYICIQTIKFKILMCNTYIRYIAGMFLLAFLNLSCSRVPVTGRSQMKLLPNSTLLGMSYTSYGDFLKEHRISTNAQQTAMVKNSGERIQKAVEKYMQQHGQSKKLDGFAWEFNLVDDPTINAWCMPGGKVVFYTGIMPLCQDEAGVAVVMGHEIAHAIANHGNERMSQGLAMQMGGIGLSLALSERPKETQELFLTAYGVGANVGAMLPFSRLHESEADHMGLIFMAMAGYDPRKAPEFWGRMSALGGGKPPEILSTHPSDETRMRKLEALMPEALKYYQK